MIKFNIEKITQDEIKKDEHVKERFNSNNHYIEKRPDDYYDVITKTYANNWIDLFHKDYDVIYICGRDLSWMKRACAIGMYTAKFPKMYQDELEDMLGRYEDTKELFQNGNVGYFIRTDSVSLKYGQHGAGPYYDMKSIIESLVTSIYGHSPIKDTTDHIKLYLLPWKDIDSSREFRVFVCNNKITAISQQNLYETNNSLALLSDEESDSTVTEWGNVILKYFNEVISTKITHINDYTIDICLIGDGNEPYFIETNCFGKEYAAGSALFHWIVDEDKLYGKDSDTIYIRYTI